MTINAKSHINVGTVIQHAAGRFTFMVTEVRETDWFAMVRFDNKTGDVRVVDLWDMSAAQYFLNDRSYAGRSSWRIVCCGD